MCCQTSTQSFGPFEVAPIPPKVMKMKNTKQKHQYKINLCN